MNKVKGVITIDYSNRFCDKIAIAMHKLKLYETDGYYPILENATDEEVAAFYCIQGSKPVVRFLEKITDYHTGNPVEIFY